MTPKIVLMGMLGALMISAQPYPVQAPKPYYVPVPVYIEPPQIEEEDDAWIYEPSAAKWC